MFEISCLSLISCISWLGQVNCSWYVIKKDKIVKNAAFSGFISILYFSASFQPLSASSESSVRLCNLIVLQLLLNPSVLLKSGCMKHVWNMYETAVHVWLQPLVGALSQLSSSSHQQHCCFLTGETPTMHCSSISSLHRRHWDSERRRCGPQGEWKGWFQPDGLKRGVKSRRFSSFHSTTLFFSSLRKPTEDRIHWQDFPVITTYLSHDCDITSFVFL